MDTGSRIARRFIVLRKVGEGGMGVVFAARDETDGSIVALKLLSSLADEARIRFAREAEALRTLEHPGIVRYVAHGEHEGQPFLAMEWLEGEDLAAHLGRQGPLSPGDVRALARRLGKGLAFVHERGILHRDIKPGNIFLVDRQPDLATWVDFGLAAGGRMRVITALGVVVGTPGYVAPERIQGKPVDARSDVFSFGVVLWECVMGRPPFVGDPVTSLTQILLEEPPRLVTMRPEIGLGLSTLVARMMAKPPEARPADGRAVLAEIEDLGAIASSVGLDHDGDAPRLSSNERRLAGLVVVGLPAQGTSMPKSAESVAVEHGLSLVGTVPGGGVLACRPGDDVEEREIAVVRAALILARLPGVEHVSVATVHEGSGGVSRAIEAASHPHPRRVPGAVRVDSRTERLLPARFTRLVDGAACFVTGERDVLDAPRDIRGEALPFVGRERELASLVQATDDALTTRHLAWLVISGEAGIGKSRLRQEALRALGQRRPDLDVLVARGDPASRRLPLGTFAAFVRHLARIDPTDPGGSYSRLRARVDRHVDAAEASRVTELLAELACVPVTMPLPAPADAPRDPLVTGRRLRWALRTLLAAEVSARPVLFVLEDLQYVDPASVELLVELCATLSSGPLVLWAIGPPPFTSSVLSRVAAAHLASTEHPLDELSPVATLALARAALGPGAGDSDVQSVVDTAGRGVPLLIEEVARSCLDEGAPSTHGVPHVEARMQALGSELRSVLRAASLCGPVTWRGAIAAVLGVPPDRIDASLDELVDQSWLFERPLCRFPDERELSFVGDAARDAAEALMVDEDRVTGHAIVGRWLERIGTPDDAAIAWHLVRGGAVHVAALHYARAAERSLGLGDERGALELAGRGRSCGPDPSTAAWLLVTQARARRALGDDRHALEDAREAMRILSEADLDRLDRWFDAARQAVCAARGLERPQILLELAATIGRSIELQDTLGAEVAAVAELTQALLEAGHGERALPLCDWLERTAPRFQDEPFVAAVVAHVQAWRAFSRGDWFAARALLSRALELAAFDLDVGLDARLHADLGRAKLELGELEGADRDLGRALDLAKKAHATLLVARTQSDAGLARFRMGKHAEGVERVREAVGILASRASPSELDARLRLAGLLLEAGRSTEAQAEARLAIERAPDPRSGDPARAVLARISSR